MGEPIITVGGVSKRYRLGERQQYQALRDVLVSGLRRVAGGRGAASDADVLWALDDVSFDVREGEVLGLIGRNGAGKSTLLKILSRITTPTAGEIRLQGRVGSLLEVGTGFHPELSGRENVYLSGAILGMGRREIRSKLDEIAAFAEMEQFLTTPVKHYSVGMYMRLAFAVAAHLDTDILIVDEVLAVGDARFQKRCLGKISEAARNGRTVLFVSHNLEITRQLCDRCILLDHGRLLDDGVPSAVVDHYLTLSGVRTVAGQRIDLTDLAHSGSGQARMVAATYRGDDGGTPVSGGALELEVEVEAREPLIVPSFGITLTTETGVLLVNADSAAEGEPVVLEAGPNVVRFAIPAVHLAPGQYRVGLRLANPATTRIGSGAVDLVDPAFHVRFEEGGDLGRAHDALVPARLRAGAHR